MISHAKQKPLMQLFKHFKHWLSRCCIAASLTLPALPGMEAHANVTWPPPEPVQQRVESVVKLVDRLQTLVPKPLNDVNDRAFSLDFDFDAAIEYVTSNVQYEPYRGVLRGPEGAATVGAGNAWDQALLLASLIKTMGGDAQIVAGALSDIDARRLLQQAFAKPTLPSQEERALNKESIAAALEGFDPNLAETFRQEIARFSDESERKALANDTARITNEIVALVKKSTPEFATQQSADSIVESIAADYVWVRWRVGPNSEWADLHPAFGTQPAPALEPQRYFSDEVPEEFQHRVALQLFIERGIDNDSTVPELVPIMSRWDRPTANLYRDQIVVGMAPQSPDGSMDSAVLIPSLNGVVAPDGLAVTRLGLTADPSAAASAAGKVFATLSSQSGKAAGALGGMATGDTAAIPQLLGVVLKIDIQSPEGQQTFSRRVADLRGMPDDAFPKTGAFQMILDVNIGPEDPLAHYHEALQHFKPFVRVMPPMVAMARNALSVEDMMATAAYRDLKAPLWQDFSLFVSAVQEPKTETATTFRAGPLVAGRRTNTAPDGKLITVTDVLWNPSTVLNKSDDGAIHVNTKGAVAQGVRETLLESSLAGVAPGWSTRTPSTIVVDAKSLKSERFSAWPEAALNAARADLGAGYLLAITNEPEPSWWRVDPRSGQTLGMTMHGGSEVMQYVILVAGIAISMFMLKSSVEECDVTYANDKTMADCCIVGNVMVTYGTSTGGSAAGALLPIEAPAKAATGALHATLSSTAADIGAGYLIGELDIVGAACRSYLN